MPAESGKKGQKSGLLLEFVGASPQKNQLVSFAVESGYLVGQFPEWVRLVWNH